jgi:hypothetical protein
MLGLYEQRGGLRHCGPCQAWAGRLALLLGALICFTGAARADAVKNGNFSAENTGFSSSYMYSTATPFGAGDYTVGTDPNSINSAWVVMGDHTSGTGYMLIANGASDGTSAVWYETVSVTPNTTYTFTAWVADVDNANNNSSPETLSFLVGSSVLGSGFSPSTPGVWTEFSTTFFSGSDTSETLEIIDTNTASEGNDFALDDISYVGAPTTAATPEPSSLLLLGSGLVAGLGWIRRRKARESSS